MMTPTGMGKVWQNYAKQVNWKIEKGKAGIREGVSGSYVYDFRVNQADVFNDAWVAGSQAGVISQAGAWNQFVDPLDPSYSLRLNGRETFIDAMKQDYLEKIQAGSDDTLMNRIRNATYAARGVNINYDWVDA